ncbi:MAG: glycosyltransferase family 2 protein [Planctomycetes bacterium]|nr:glycosyltransferase family 2 protein [Planctomycetota bacterium]
MSISVVIPIFNERENIRRQYDALMEVLPQLDRRYEIIFVDDGSSDGSDKELKQLALTDSKVRVVELRHNFGQTAAMSAGIHAATGDVIVTMDGDLQNDPTDIPMMLEKIDEGYDLVHGWRKNRQDPFLNRRLPSIIANRIISKVTGFPVHDLGCTLKVIRREVAQELSLYGEMHRFIPILAHWRGARCIEVVVNHHSRKFGTSKYGLSRTFRVILDLITVNYLIRYLVSPMKLFGVAGLTCGFVGSVAGFATVWMKLFRQIDMTGNPLLMLSVFSIMLGVQFFGMGMLGELGARIYYQERKFQSYAIRRLLNFDESDEPPVRDSRPRRAA